MNAPSSLPRVGETIDRYQVLLEVARGGMGVVYVVRRSTGHFEKLLAMKMMYPNLAAEQRAVDMFLDEARIAALIEHPNVVHVVDLGQHQGCPFLVMEYLRGRSLAIVRAQAKEQHRTLDPGFVLAALAQAAQGLHAAHEARTKQGEPLSVVHRDVSPHNIHLGFEGNVKVIDFGIAAAKDRLSSTRTGEIKGKYAYMAPEIVSGARRQDRRADIWALGVVAWELLSGRHLFKAESDATTLWNVMNLEVRDVGELPEALPGAAARAVLGCLERDPRKRPPSCKELSEIWAEAATCFDYSRSEHLAEVMQELFVDEANDERTRLAQAERASLATQESGQARTMTWVEDPEIRWADAVENEAQATSRSSPRWRVATAALLGVGSISGWIAFGGTSGGASEPSQVRAGTLSSVARPPNPTVRLVPSTALPVSVPTSTRRERIRLEVDPGIKWVLVDGQRHEERPVVIELDERERAKVETMAKDGKVSERVVDAQDDGERLAPESTRRRSARKSPRPARLDSDPQLPQTPDTPELLDNPFLK